MRRVHRRFSEEQLGRVAAEAKSRNSSFVDVVREGVEAMLAPRWPDRTTAAERILSAEPMDVPETVAALRGEIDDGRGRHM